MTLGAARISARAGVPGAQEVLFRKVDERLRDVRGGPDEVLYLLTDSPQERVLRVPPR